MVAEQDQAYSLLPEKEPLDDLKQEYIVSQRVFSRISRILVAILLLSNIFFIGYIASYENHQIRPRPVFSIFGDSPTYPVSFLHFTNYSSVDGSNDEEMRTRWHNIDGAPGIVALDHAWAAAHGLQKAGNLPSDNTKGVYVVDVYHSIHCIVMLRESWYRLRDHDHEPNPTDKTYRRQQAHVSHCWDFLLQSTICNPSEHMFAYNAGHIGDGQERQCRDWRVMRDWTAEHTACDPKDTEGKNVRILEVPTLCHGKDDFVPHRIDTV